MKKSNDDDDDDDDFGRARAGATTSLEGSDAFAAASASVETWGRGDRTGTDSREDGIEDDDAARVAIENAARAMRRALAMRTWGPADRRHAKRKSAAPRRVSGVRLGRTAVRARGAGRASCLSPSEFVRWRIRGRRHTFAGGAIQSCAALAGPLSRFQAQGAWKGNAGPCFVPRVRGRSVPGTLRSSRRTKSCFSPMERPIEPLRAREGPIS